MPTVYATYPASEIDIMIKALRDRIEGVNARVDGLSGKVSALDAKVSKPSVVVPPGTTYQPRLGDDPDTHLFALKRGSFAWAVAKACTGSMVRHRSWLPETGHDWNRLKIAIMDGHLQTDEVSDGWMIVP